MTDLNFSNPNSLSTNDELTAYVQQISLAKFKRPFEHTAYWNTRLRSTGGRFFPADLHLDFNPKMANLPEFDQIILHELVHYHLFRQKLGYQHKDLAFKKLLREVGGLRYAPAIAGNKAKYVYLCTSCGQEYFRQRKINTRSYRCGKCAGKLRLSTEN